MTNGGDVALDGSDMNEVAKWRKLRGGAVREFATPITAVLSNDTQRVVLYDQRDGGRFVVQDWQAQQYLEKPLIEKYEGRGADGKSTLLSRTVFGKALYARTPPARPSVLPFRPVGEDAKAVTVGQTNSRKRRRGSRGKR